jgi:5-hydroxyisourate hydrolase
VSTLSTHVLDIERGVPAAGVVVGVSQAGVEVGRAQTGVDGRVNSLGDGLLGEGAYVLTFEVAGYFAALGRPAPFLRRVSIEFQVEGNQGHYHVPLLLSAFGCTSYRGS